MRYGWKVDYGFPFLLTQTYENILMIKKELNNFLFYYYSTTSVKHWMDRGPLDRVCDTKRDSDGKQQPT